jgi:hypothetical protein
MVDSKLTALTALSTPAGEDLFYVVDDPSGTPTGKKITLTDLLGVAHLDFATANTLKLVNSTNAQTFNLYNTYTDASNYERGFMKWNSNVLEIGTEAAGTGTARALALNGTGSVTTQIGGFARFIVDNGTVRPNADGLMTLGSDSTAWHAFYLGERGSDPFQPSEGSMVMWVSNGTGLGDDGDVIIGVTAGGATKYTIVHDHSGATTWP